MLSAPPMYAPPLAPGPPLRTVKVRMPPKGEDDDVFPAADGRRAAPRKEESDSGDEEAPSRSADRTLYDRLGERDVIEDIVDEFYDRVLADDRVNGYFEETNVADLRAHQVEFFSAAIGGPIEYTGRDLRDAHVDFEITERAFDIVVGHLDGALAACRISPADRDAMLVRISGLKRDVVAP